MINQTYNNLNVSNNINATTLQCNSIISDTISISDAVTISNLNLTGKINNNTTLQNLNSLDTTSSITSQFINAKNYTDEKINLLLNNPDANVNSISELFKILGNDPNLNVVNSLADKISKSQANQTITALNMNWTNPIIANDFTIKNIDNTTKSVKNSITTIETNITSLTSNKLDKTGGSGTDNVFYSPLVGQYMYILNSGSNPPLFTRSLNAWNAIGSNISKGQKELNFVNYDTALYNSISTKAFVFSKMSDETTYDDFLIIYNNGNAKLKGDLVIDNGNISLTGLNTNLTTISNKLTTIDSGLIVNTNDISVSKAINSTQDISALSFSTLNTISCDNIKAIDTGKVLNINQGLTDGIVSINGKLGLGTINPVNTLHVMGDGTFSGSTNTTGTTTTGKLKTTSIVSTSVNNPIQVNSGLGSSAVMNVNGKLGVNISDIVAGSVFHVNGDSTLDGRVNVNNTLNAKKLTIPVSDDTFLDVEDYLYNSTSLINTNANNITTNTTNINIIRTYLNTYPRFGYSGSQNKLVSGNQYTTQKAPTITFINKNPNRIDGFNAPLTFSVKAFFYANGVVNQTTFDIMFLATAPFTWDTDKIYNFNNDIGNASSFTATNRPYWTFNQVFTSNATPKGNIVGVETNYTTTPVELRTTYQTYKIYFYFQFLSPSTYSISIETLDISGASDFDVSIGLT